MNLSLLQISQIPERSENVVHCEEIVIITITTIIIYREVGWHCRTSLVSPVALILPDSCVLPRVRISKGVSTTSLFFV